MKKVQYYLGEIRKTSPLGILHRACCKLEKSFKQTSAIKGVSANIKGLLTKAEYHLDSHFDRRCGTDTTGTISVEELNYTGEHIETAIWYEPMSEKTFPRIMKTLTIDVKQFEFIDFGSGKGRVLLMAAGHGFKKVIGVEYVQDLNTIAANNIGIYRDTHIQSPVFETICMDAADYELPAVPLVLFFYSPFKGKLMRQVIVNIVRSYHLNPREIFLLFHGQNPETLDILKSSFQTCKELKIPNDWSRINNYRSFLFTEPRKMTGASQGVQA